MVRWGAGRYGRLPRKVIVVKIGGQVGVRNQVVPGGKGAQLTAVQLRRIVERRG